MPARLVQVTLINNSDFPIKVMKALLIFAALLASVSVADAASSKIVILTCQLSQPVTVVVVCNKTANVTSACPGLGASCVDALASFTSPPDNLRVIGMDSGPNNGVIYTLTGTIFPF